MTATARDPFHKYNFRVEIDGFRAFYFTKCSSLDLEVGEVKYRPGGQLVEVKRAGLVTFPDITLERGASKDEDAYNWMKEVVDVTAGIGGSGRPASQYLRQGHIIQLERDKTVLQRYRLVDVWPKKYGGGEWDSNSEEVLIESIVLSVGSWWKVLT